MSTNVKAKRTHEPKDNRVEAKGSLKENAYKMSSFPRGGLIFINEINFPEEKHARKGADKDADNLWNLFEELGFRIREYEDLTEEQIKNVIAEIEDRDYSDVDCFVFAIGTHGGTDVMVTSDGKIMPITEIPRLAKSEKLKGKPKMFIFQACRGSNYLKDHTDAGRSPLDTQHISSHDTEHDQLIADFPYEKHCSYLYANTREHKAFRGKFGSHMIFHLTKVFREHSHKMDLLGMIARMSEEMSLLKLNEGDKHGNIIEPNNKQMPSLVSTMDKELFFNPPFGPLKYFEAYDEYLKYK